MIDFLYNAFFGCRHRRTSFPLRPPAEPGGPPSEMYVVCLDCGKRFHYDWEQMRIGGPVQVPGASTVAGADSRKVRNKKRKLPYVVAASALPVIWLLGKAAGAHRRSKTVKEKTTEPKD